MSSIAARVSRRRVIQQQDLVKYDKIGTWKLPAGIEAACGLCNHIFSCLNPTDIVRFKKSSFELQLCKKYKDTIFRDMLNKFLVKPKTLWSVYKGVENTPQFRYLPHHFMLAIFCSLDVLKVFITHHEYISFLNIDSKDVHGNDVRDMSVVEMVNMRGPGLDTGLILVARFKMVEIVEYLLNNGADVSLTNGSDGCNAVHYACTVLDNLPVLKLLVNHSTCTLDVINKENGGWGNLRPLDMAASRDMTEFLISKGATRKGFPEGYMVGETSDDDEEDVGDDDNDVIE